MDARTDIQLSKAYINSHNDFEWINSDIKHIKAIINATPGSYKENHSMGVGIKNYLNSSGAEIEVKRKVMIELQSDLYPCNNPVVTYSQPGKLTIDPNL